ncbi:MAG: two-component regulator propeller domain-containing protein, partial [Bacteroidota bacterium]
YLIGYFEDGEGNIWFSSSKKEVACMRKDGKVETFESEKDLGMALVRLFWEDEKGELWMAGHESGPQNAAPRTRLFFRNHAKNRVVDYPLKVHGLPFPGAAAGPQAEVYYATREALFLHEDTLTRLKFPADFLPNKPPFILPLARDTIILCTQNGAYKFARNRDRLTLLHHWLPEKEVSSAMRDREGNLWFSTIRDGVYMQPNKAHPALRKGDGLIADRISRLAMGEDGTLWLAYNTNRVSRLRAGQLSHFTLPVPPARLNYDMLVDRSGTPWIMASEMWYRLVDGTFKGPSVQAKTLAPLQNGRLITGRGEVLSLDGHILDTVVNPMLQWKRNYAIAETGPNQFLIGSKNGLIQTDGPEYTRLFPDAPISQLRVTGLLHDHHGRI